MAIYIILQEIIFGHSLLHVERTKCGTFFHT